MDVIEEEEEDQDAFHRYQQDDGGHATDNSAASWRSLAQPNQNTASSTTSESSGSVEQQQIPGHEGDAAHGMIKETAADAALLGLFDGDFVRQPNESASATASEKHENEPQIQPEPATAGQAVIASPPAVSAQGNSRSRTGSSTTFGGANASNEDDYDGILFDSQNTEAPIDANLRLDGSTDESIGAVSSQQSSHRYSQGVPAPAISADGFPAEDTGAAASETSVIVHAADRQPPSEQMAPLDQPVQDGTAPGHLVASIGPPAPHVDAQPTPTSQSQQQGTQSATGGQHAELYAAVLPAPGEIGDSKAIAVAQATLRQQLLSTAAWLEGELAQLTKAAQVRIICEAPLTTARQRVGL